MFEVFAPRWIVVGVVVVFILVTTGCGVEAMTMPQQHGDAAWQFPQRVAPLGKPALPLPPIHNNNGLPEPHPSVHPLPSQTPIHNMHQSLTASSARMITSKCSCGGLQLQFPAVVSDNKNDICSMIADCHCAACRRYHVAAVVRYLRVDQSLHVTGDTAHTYSDRCATLGTVTRTYCRRCQSKLLTTKVIVMDNDGSSSSISSYAPPEQYVNMGPIDDTTVPPAVAQHWSSLVVEQWQAHMAVAWATARPRFAPGRQRAPIVVRGSCTCTTGAAFAFVLDAPTEVQHCHCYLCRQLSGGLYMTWMPVQIQAQQFTWTSAPAQPPARQRYTNMGERHVCRTCGGVLSIVYDYEAERTVWLAVGSFDAVSLPYNLGPYLERAAHICCRYRPQWNVAEPLPPDVEQLPDAS